MAGSSFQDPNASISIPNRTFSGQQEANSLRLEKFRLFVFRERNYDEKGGPYIYRTPIRSPEEYEAVFMRFGGPRQMHVLFEDIYLGAIVIGLKNTGKTYIRIYDAEVEYDDTTHPYFAIGMAMMWLYSLHIASQSFYTFRHVR